VGDVALHGETQMVLLLDILQGVVLPHNRQKVGMMMATQTIPDNMFQVIAVQVAARDNFHMQHHACNKIE
jgi:hypothetical protein